MFVTGVVGGRWWRLEWSAAVPGVGRRRWQKVVGVVVVFCGGTKYEEIIVKPFMVLF